MENHLKNTNNKIYFKGTVSIVLQNLDVFCEKFGLKKCA